MLYPEKSRDELEIYYHAMTAAVRLAAVEKVGSDENAILAQIEDWLVRSEEYAVKSGNVRQQRNLAAFDGVKQ